MKQILMISVLYMIFAHECKAQNSSETIPQKIKMDDSEKTLVFPNGKKVLWVEHELGVLSPNNQLAALCKYPASNKGTSFLQIRILDISGKEIKKMKISGNSLSDISNTGDIAILANSNDTNYIQLNIYDKESKLKYKLDDKISNICVGDYTESGYYIFHAKYNNNKTAKLWIINPSYKLNGSYTFGKWPARSFIIHSRIYDDSKEIVVMQYIFNDYTDPKNKNITYTFRKEFTIDYKGILKKEEELTPR